MAFYFYFYLMKSLFIIRHAKSNQSFLGNDFERPLNERGLRDAPEMAKRLVNKVSTIDAFISSPALRAKTTAEFFVKEYAILTDEIIFITSLYHSPAENFYAILKQLPNELNSVALFAHNPGITYFANELIKNVSNAYYNWLYSWQKYNLILQTDSIFADYEKYANKKYQLGESNKLEKINATLQRKDLILQLAQANTEVSFFLADMQKWIGSREQYKPPLQFTKLPEINLSDSGLVNKHPVLQFLQQQITSKEFAIKAEKAKGQPSFNLGVNTQSLDKQTHFYYGSVGINIPLFKNGVKARTQAAKFETEIAKKEFDKTQHEISTIFSQQNQLQQQSLQQLKYYQAEGLPMAESIINAAQHSYKAGDIGYIEYIQNIKDAFKIKTDYLATINSYNQTIIKLNYLLNR